MTTPTQILLNEDVAIKLLSYTASTHLEFSGFGFCNLVGSDIIVYDFVLMNVGSSGYTEIDPKLVLKLMDRPDAKNMKVWIHKHPIGSGVPGPNNWSGRDEMTCIEEPMGGVPELVKWSAAVVITPHGWVGRVDNHVSHKTLHLPVLPEVLPFHSQIAEITPRGRDQEEAYPSGGQGYQATPFAPIGNYRLPFPVGTIGDDGIEVEDPMVAAVAAFFTEAELSQMHWTRDDLVIWITDDLEVFEGDPANFVTEERDHLRVLMGEY